MATSDSTFDYVAIPLTQGFYTFVSPEDEDFIQYEWCVLINRSGLVHARHSGRYINGKQQSVHLHREILKRMLGRDLTPIEQVDHINGAGLLNCRWNLRLATPQQNSQNRPLRSDNTSGVQGVWRDKVSRKWRANIRVGGKCIHLGMYEEIADAEAARIKAEREYFGEFAPSLSR